jgi:hypothetical protein
MKMGLDFVQSKELENLKGHWTLVTNLQKVGYEIPTALLKMLTLLSGGAMVGTLTFLGNLWTRNDSLAREVGKDVSNGLFWFAVSLGLTLFSGFVGWMSYWILGHVLAQSFLRGVQSKAKPIMYPLVFSMMLCTFLSLVAFLYAMYASITGLTKHM